MRHLHVGSRAVSVAIGALLIACTSSPPKPRASPSTSLHVADAHSSPMHHPSIVFDEAFAYRLRAGMPADEVQRMAGAAPVQERPRAHWDSVNGSTLDVDFSADRLARAMVRSANGTVWVVDAYGVTTGQHLPPPVWPGSADVATVLEAAQRWADAWSRGDFPAYLEAYSLTYHPPGQSRARWMKEREHKVTSAKAITVEVADPQIFFVSATRARVRFRQRYRSPSYHDEVNKVLDYSLVEGGWKIIGEQTL